MSLINSPWNGDLWKSLFGDPSMGSGILAQPPLSAFQIQQAQALAAQQNAGIGIGVPDSYCARTSPAHVKIQEAINKAVAQLPFRLALKIDHIKFGPEVVGFNQLTFEHEYKDLGFVVKYISGKEIKFYDIDEFPTDADIARIALEAG
jgi:hypothetical protein